MSLSKYSGKKANEPMCAVKIYLKMWYKDQAMLRWTTNRLRWQMVVDS